MRRLSVRGRGRLPLTDPSTGGRSVEDMDEPHAPILDALRSIPTIDRTTDRVSGTYNGLKVTVTSDQGIKMVSTAFV